MEYKMNVNDIYQTYQFTVKIDGILDKNPDKAIEKMKQKISEEVNCQIGQINISLISLERIF